MAPSRPLTTKQQEWISHLEQAQQKSLSLQEYARQTGVRASSLYAARKWLREPRSQVTTPPVSFSEVRMTGSGVDGVACTLHLARGIRLQLSDLPTLWSPRS